MARRHFRCLIGLHSWVRRHPPDERDEGPDHKVCRRCGKETGPWTNVPPGFLSGSSGGGMA